MPNWKVEQASWPIPSRLKRLVVGATGGRGYIATFEEVDTLGRPIAPAFWAGSVPHLTRYDALTDAQKHALPLPLEAIWTLTDEVRCRYVRLYHRPIDEEKYAIRAFHPHLLNIIQEPFDA